MTELRVETLTLPGARLGEENPFPFFRDPQVSLPVQADESLPPEKRLYLGWETAFRALPYRMQDEYSRRREPLSFRSIILENEQLVAAFLPEMGGRLISLFDKPHGRELLHCNPVFQPANLAIRNAWFSGGVEWNIAQFGHTFTTCSPLFASAIEGAHGEPGLRLYEYERCKGYFWQIDFYLPPGFPFLLAYTRVVNADPVEKSMYWWTNIAANEAPGVRVLAPASEAIYIDLCEKSASFGLTHLPGLPSLNGVDGTYSLNSTFANEFFFQCDGADIPWEAALDPQGSGLIEASTPRLRYRKLFCWGSHAGGRHWQEFLSEPGQAYLEVQAGLAPTQVHGLPMPGRTAWDWTQVFGYLQADPARVHSPDWETAWKAVDAELKSRLSAEQFRRLEEDCRSRADYPSSVFLQAGSGWGALELHRRAKDPQAGPVPASFLFPGASIGPEQAKWLALLERGVLPEQDPARLPGEWMVQGEWRQLLESSIEGEADRAWYAWLHLGVMRLECFDEPGAEAAWEESIRRKPSIWAYRNLGNLRLRQKREQEAAQYYDQAWKLAVESGVFPPALAVETLRMLHQAGQAMRGMQVYNSIPASIRDSDRIQILRGQIAMELGDLQAVEEVLQRDYSIVQEGETVLTDLWFELQARRQAAQTGQPLTDDLRQKVKAECAPPSRIDFRSVNEG